MKFENLTLENKNSVAVLTINRPEKLNALNGKTLAELKTAFIELTKDNNTKVVIVTGSGEKAFIAGADIVELNKLVMQEQ